MGFTGDEAPIQGDVIIDRYIVVLKPLLDVGEVEAHCSQIQSLYNQQTSVSPTGGTFNKFSIGPLNGAHAAGATSMDTSHQIMGPFSKPKQDKILMNDENTPTRKSKVFITRSETENLAREDGWNIFEAGMEPWPSILELSASSI